MTGCMQKNWAGTTIYGSGWDNRPARGSGKSRNGFLIGAGVGLAAVFVPPILSLIATHHPEEAKLLIIAGWGAGVLVLVE